MAIQIGGTTVIDNSRNYVAISSVSTGIAGTQTWNSGQSSINIDGTTGNIKIDGTITAINLIIPLAWKLWKDIHLSVHWIKNKM